MQILFQVLTAILSVVAILQKDKWKMLLVYTIYNKLRYYLSNLRF